MHPGRIVTIEDVMTALHLTTEVQRADAERALDWATSTIERETGTAWIARRETRTYDAPAERGAELGRILDLNSHVREVFRVELSGLQVTDFRLIPKRGQLFRDAGWVSGDIIAATMIVGIQNIEVDAMYGLYDLDGEADEGDPPHDITQACLDLIAGRLNGSIGSGSGDGNLQSERIGDYAYTRKVGATASEGGIFGIPDDIARVLVSRRRW